MTPLPPVPGVLKVSLEWGIEDDPSAFTIFHLKYTGGPPSAGNCATMAAAINADAGTRFAALLTSMAQVNPVTVLDLSSDMGGEGEGGGVHAGTRTGGNLAPATSVVVSKHVGRHYRGGHPRSYLPLGTQTDLNGGSWDPDFVTTVATAWGNFISDCTSDGTGCTITGEASVSYFSGGARRVTPHVDDIISYEGKVLIGSQRRRNRKQ